MKYYSGVDTGEGIGSDNSVSEIIDSEGYQVFEFASNKIKPYEFAELVRAVGVYYGKSLLVVEKMSAVHTVVDNLYGSSNRYINLYIGITMLKERCPDLRQAVRADHYNQQVCGVV